MDPGGPACCVVALSGLPKLGFVRRSCARFSELEVENKARNAKPHNTTAVARTRNALLRSMLFWPRVLISTRLGRLRSSLIRRQICCTMPVDAVGASAGLVSTGFDSSSVLPVRLTRVVNVGSSCSLISRSSLLIVSAVIGRHSSPLENC